MKIIVLLLLVGCLQVSATSVAQTVNLNVKNEQLIKVLGMIERQASVYFLYNQKDLEQVKVTANLENVKVETALSKILQGHQLTFVIDGRNIAIERKKSAAPETENQLSFPDSLINIQGTVLNNQNVAVVGATVSVKGTNIGTSTASDGSFSLQGVKKNAILLITSVGYESKLVKVTGESSISIQLAIRAESMVEVTVVNTGYQKLPKERSTGSFTFVDSALYNRAVGSNVLNRLEGVASGVQFIKGQRLGTNELIGISIRGRSTLDNKVSADPLVILDNFPYEGSLDNINPNDVESITILKDAAAASIWGARSGNGVIVISTKRGTLNKKMQITVNSNFSFTGKSNLHSQKILNSTDFIEIEKNLFDSGYFNSDLINKSTRPPVSPIVEILGKLRNNLISQTDADNELNYLRNIDGLDDQQKYLYRTAQMQQYSVNLRGGNNISTFYLSAGFDKNVTVLRGNETNRFSLNSIGSYFPVKNLTITAKLRYTYTKALNNALSTPTTGGKYAGLLPYSKLVDENGNPLAVLKDYRASFVDSVSNLGYLDWHYRPLDELRFADNTSKLTHFIIGGQAKYQIIPDLSIEIDYQNERQTNSGRNYQSIETYYTRNLINRYSVRNPASGLFTYPLPKGGILDLSQNELGSNNLRANILYNRSFNNDHVISALVGAERRETRTTGYARRSYGYDDEFGTAASVINFATSFPLFPYGTARIPGVDGGVNGVISRFISYYGNISYTYQGKYTATLSGRKDGANLFGVKTNDKFTPLWSTGIKWAIDRENFFHSNLITNLGIRATYGFNGNVYNAPAYLIAYYTSLLSLTGNPFAVITDPPNPSLRWEKVRNINIGIDYGLRKGILSGLIEFYEKDGTDLIEDVPLAPSTGFPVFKGNAASTRTKGVDLSINSNVIANASFKWQLSFLLQLIKDKVIGYDPKVYPDALTGRNSILYPVVGKPIFSVFSYKWAGLDPVNGDPQGFDEKGELSKDYASIYRNTPIENLKFHGSARPTIFGSFRNTIYYKDLQFSFNILYSLGYYFRRNSLNLNYTALLLNAPGASDFRNRWITPGDEARTQIPSVAYPNNDYRNSFYQSSEILVEKGDNIRLQDIQLTYTIDRNFWLKIPVQSLQIYMYASNLGIIWRANNKGIDPDYINGLRPPFSIAFGLKANL